MQAWVGVEFSNRAVAAVSLRSGLQLTELGVNLGLS